MKSKNQYDKQDRGNSTAYEQYFAGMDASMQQKIALTTAHFPSSGKIADMGSGSGRGTFDLAALYEHLTVVGVDINPATVEYSSNQYKAKNLSFIIGDIAGKVFENESLDGILDSSVLHHVTSFNGFDKNEITKTLANQVAQLKSGGVIIIRDFVIPDDCEKLVYLDLPGNDGKSKGEIPEISTAALFEIFAANFRSSVNLSESVKFKARDCPRETFARFEVTLKTAAEFVLRKDYRDHWEPELLEEYTYYTQREFEEAFRSNDLRIVVSMPVWNPWIVANRFQSMFYISDLTGNHITFPPTNYLIVGEKIAINEGVVLQKTESICDIEPKFLKRTAYQHLETKQIFELIERPNQTIDILPWFEIEGQIFVLAKKDFPRPIVNAISESKNLNRANYSGYLTEPISAIAVLELLNAEFQDPIVDILASRANIAQNEILEISEPNFYFPSAGGIDEQVSSFLVKITPLDREPQSIENYTAYTNAGVVRELDALQVLRASHVGGMFDARLEINIYRLLKTLSKSPSSWIGAKISPAFQSPPVGFRSQTVSRLIPKQACAFKKVNLSENSFLRVDRGTFSEFDSRNNKLAQQDFEYVIPGKLSKNTVAAIPFFQTDMGIFVGLEFRDLPAAQRFSGNSQIVCVPAWRLPKEIDHKFELEDFLLDKFSKDFGVSIKNSWELGGSYFTSPGITPEMVYPFAVEINAENIAQTDIRFFNLSELISSLKNIKDAHLLILANRLAHALGEFN